MFFPFLVGLSKSNQKPLLFFILFQRRIFPFIFDRPFMGDFSLSCCMFLSCNLQLTFFFFYFKLQFNLMRTHTHWHKNTHNHNTVYMYGLFLWSFILLSRLLSHRKYVGWLAGWLVVVAVAFLYVMHTIHNTNKFNRIDTTTHKSQSQKWHFYHTIERFVLIFYCCCLGWISNWNWNWNRHFTIVNSVGLLKSALLFLWVAHWTLEYTYIGYG